MCGCGLRGTWRDDASGTGRGAGARRLYGNSGRVPGADALPAPTGWPTCHAGEMVVAIGGNWLKRRVSRSRACPEGNGAARYGASYRGRRLAAGGAGRRGHWAGIAICVILAFSACQGAQTASAAPVGRAAPVRPAASSIRATASVKIRTPGRLPRRPPAAGPAPRGGRAGAHAPGSSSRPAPGAVLAERPLSPSRPRPAAGPRLPNGHGRSLTHRVSHVRRPAGSGGSPKGPRTSRRPAVGGARNPPALPAGSRGDLTARHHDLGQLLARHEHGHPGAAGHHGLRRVQACVRDRQRQGVLLGRQQRRGAGEQLHDEQQYAGGGVYRRGAVGGDPGADQRGLLLDVCGELSGCGVLLGV